MGLVAISAASNLGRVKKENQDAYVYYSGEKGSSNKGTLMALADGIGGYTGGKRASRIAVDVLMEEYYRDAAGSIPESLIQAFRRANEKVLETSRTDLALDRMGTTLTAAVVKKNSMYYAHVGDSRGYLIDKDGISQFTQDHSYVASLVKAGAITEEEAKTHPEKNLITNAIGLDSEFKIDMPETHIDIAESRYILLCCDGLYNVVPDEEILSIADRYQSPGAICKKLVETANERGGPDNITVLTAKVAAGGFISNLVNGFLNIVR